LGIAASIKDSAQTDPIDLHKPPCGINASNLHCETTGIIILIEFSDAQSRRFPRGSRRRRWNRRNIPIRDDPGRHITDSAQHLRVIGIELIRDNPDLQPITQILQNFNSIAIAQQNKSLCGARLVLQLIVNKEMSAKH